MSGPSDKPRADLLDVLCGTLVPVARVTAAGYEDLTAQAELAWKLDALAAAVANQARDGRMPPSKWLTTEEAAKRLGMSKRALDRMKAEAEAAGVKVPCKPAGQGTQRHKWKWNPDKLDSFMEDQSWRQSDRAPASTSSRGATSGAPSVGERARRRQRRASSSSTSKQPSPSGATGSLTDHLKKLTSKR